MTYKGNILGVGAIDIDIYNYVESIDESLLVLTETGGTLTTDGTEQDVYINNAPAGVYDPLGVFLDTTNHTAGETVVLRSYYRIKSGGGWIEYTDTIYAGVQDPLLIHLALKQARYGVKVTLEKTGGVNRDYDWQAVYKV